MWAPWFGVTFGGLAIILLVAALAFGTSALLFPVLIAGGAVLVLGVFYAMRASQARRASSQNPRNDGEPADTPTMPPPPNAP